MYHYIPNRHFSNLSDRILYINVYIYIILQTATRSNVPTRRSRILRPNNVIEGYNIYYYVVHIVYNIRSRRKKKNWFRVRLLNYIKIRFYYTNDVRAV